MSEKKHPPRVNIYEYDGLYQASVIGKGFPDGEYISKSEAQEMADRAREEGVAQLSSEIRKIVEARFHPASDTGLSIYRVLRDALAASSKPSPQGGGEKKEGSK